MQEKIQAWKILLIFSNIVVSLIFQAKVFHNFGSATVEIIQMLNFDVLFKKQAAVF